MDLKVREIKTKNGKTGVQVFNIAHRKRNILKHFGSTENEADLSILKEKARLWIEEENKKCSLFQFENHFSQNYEYMGFLYLYAYEFLEKIYHKFNFQKHFSNLFQDLVLVRILEPRSKRGSLEFLQTFLNKFHSENVLYKKITKYDEKIKDKVEEEIVKVAKTEFGFDFSFVLYDVTTLYFESFKNDEFKRSGFSKDHKHNQPQIVIGLIVTREGFPISYQIFKGNTFEGNTFLPCILDFKKKHNIQSLTVVADSAMLSKQNMNTLVQNRLNYIIASRLANLKESLINTIDKGIERVNGKNIRIENLIIDYSSKKYTKDKFELEKQVNKAKEKTKVKTEKITNIKYLKNDKATQYLNQELIDKNTKLLGLKGYVTNLTEESNEEIISFYRGLVKIEHAFRIAKSDLEARPIYHHKEESIKNHMLICFVALTMSVYLEIRNKRSIQSIIEDLKSITDAKILNKITNQIQFERVRNCGKVTELEKMLH
jgi:transposase